MSIGCEWESPAGMLSREHSLPAGTQSGGLVNSAVNVLDIVPLPRFFLVTSWMNQHNSDFALSAFLSQY